MQLYLEIFWQIIKTSALFVVIAALVLSMFIWLIKVLPDWVVLLIAVICCIIVMIAFVALVVYSKVTY